MIKYLLSAVLVLSLSSVALADGAATYADKCADCHGEKGEGKKGGKNAIAGTKADAVKVAMKGKGKMKAVKGVDDAAADEVAKFVEGLKK